MIQATATDVKNRFGQYLESALVEPVTISKSGRTIAVLLSNAEYERLQRAWEENMVAQLQEDEASGRLLSVEETEAVLEGAQAPSTPPSVQAAE